MTVASHCRGYRSLFKPWELLFAISARGSEKATSLTAFLGFSGEWLYCQRSRGDHLFTE